ncbi:translation initiation factor 3 (bIF-3) [Mycoplasma testudineum]|uniref:Translation initiation factor IF-3 n=1 Tax=Mycoplasma testudineum TaxID=244584 RepID=A0A4R6IB19_9MOLU|nr:translation initiation factor IF-3 [Mycoplasma testudineum]OYD26571.1 translation initiation factor IF-3 [Mycoplasma testudineum]TDO19403.1 translation initiation factor 3 (bIF-3) [Mycoplasma testudineum]
MNQPNKKSKKAINNDDTFINDAIPFKKMYVIDENGENLGIMPKNEALDLANSKRKDLFLIRVDPRPIARILDYGKYKYQSKKKEKELKEKQTTIKNRQIRLTPLIGENDLKNKAKKTREFLLEGDRVKISLKFRGRELAHQEIGHETLKRFFALIEDVAKIDKDRTLNAGKFLDMIIHPDKKKIAKYQKEEQINKGDHDAKNED